MHRLQKHIFHKLITNSQLRYSQLKPAEVEGNLFMYHLRQLTKEGLVEKTDDGLYELTPEGKVRADQFSLQLFKPRLQPRIVTLIVCQNEEGQWLMFRRRRQPLYGQVGFPYGKLHIGESVKEAAERELKEKTGLSVALTHRGDGYISICEEGEPVSQILFHLFYGQSPSGKLKARVKAGESFWADIADIKDDKLIVSVPDLIYLLAQNPSQRFFAELNYA
ncbi:MAG TPA: NUDIX domain-containing protein [Candidatus Dormibacteraeota bacterium]|nr:NUDIX domain-containing protein [Candidatus Dormibacteraeota bacterium]